jgi:hypothetical protein
VGDGGVSRGKQIADGITLESLGIRARLVAVDPKERLHELEKKIERGLETFQEVGLALMEIREKKLYRDEHETFEAYCRARWGWSASRGRQMIAAARVAKEIAAEGGEVPKTEKEARRVARQRRGPVVTPGNAPEEIEEAEWEPVRAALPPAPDSTVAALEDAEKALDRALALGLGTRPLTGEEYRSLGRIADRILPLEHCGREAA